MARRSGTSPSAVPACTNPAFELARGCRCRVNRGQEFVIGGHTPGTNTFDALIFGYYESGRLIYVARSRNGFTPALRA